MGAGPIGDFHVQIRISAAIAAAMVMFAAPAANAAVFDVVFTGTVSGTHDTYGLFGGALVDGAAFTLTYTVDNSLGSVVFSTPADEAIGGFRMDAPVSAKLTIGGVTLDFAHYGSDLRHDASLGCLSCTDTGVELGATDYGSGSWGDYELDFQGMVQMAVLGSVAQFGGLAHTQIGSYTPADGVLMFGEFSKTGGIYNREDWSPIEQYDVGGTFEVASVNATAAAPEPGTWALMLLGFGGVGAALRRRSSAVRASA